MDFALTEEQELLRNSLSRYLQDDYDFDTRRSRLIAGHGRDPKLWDDFANLLGILGAPLPEEVGGLGGGAVETMIIMEELGASLVIEPYLESVVVGGGLLKRIGGEAAGALLSGIIAGASRVALAAMEPEGRFNIGHVGTTARRDGNGWVIDGFKSVVVDGADADTLLVTARTSGSDQDPSGISLFRVDRDTPGLEVHAYRLVDERPAADIGFKAVRVEGDALLGNEGEALPLVQQVQDEAVAALCAEAVGVMRRMLSDTVAYTRERKQFGQPLASFQALQHRMVDMYMALEQSISATYLATLKLGAPAAERGRAAAAAKATIGKAARFIGQNAVQLHGAMGMTEELPVGHYFRRTTVIEHQFGSVDHHVARYGQLLEGQAA